MKRTSFRPGWRRQNAGQKVYSRTRICICLSAAGRSCLCPFFSFFFLEEEEEEEEEGKKRRRKGAYVFDSLVEREKGREGATEPEFFFFFNQYATTLVVKGKRKRLIDQ